MQFKRYSIVLNVFLALFAAALALTPAAQAASEQVLYSFTDGADGGDPVAGLVFDGAGNLYGTTYYGGSSDYGTVFELTPGGGGKWTESVLFSFTGGKDGGEPNAGLIFDAAGNLYGTTYLGGAHGHGTAFMLSPKGGGKWTEKVLHSFSGGKDGGRPSASLIFDAAGNLYGTTAEGGKYEYGAAFMLVPPGVNGKWTVTTLHSFNANGKDGYTPLAGLVFDATGNLYGTTWAGGKDKNGIVFELTPGANGKWTETIIHNFNPANGKDGSSPVAGLIFDAAGNLYSTTPSGGSNRFYGIVFELTPGANGKWTETILHTFDDVNGGGEPNAGLIWDAAGNLYGTTVTGGTAGVLFELTLGGNGKWKETVLHDFKGGKDGGEPYASVIFDAAGNLYGTTKIGGPDSSGTVFELTP